MDKLFQGWNLIILIIGAAIGAVLLFRYWRGGGVAKVIEATTKATIKALNPEVRGIRTLTKASDLKQIPEMKGEAPKEELAPAKPAIYPAMVYTPAGIVFKKIPEKVGYPFYFDPSIPEHGEHFIVNEVEPGKYEAYDPREVPVIDNETPEYAWDALEWDKDVQGFWANDHGIWDKINMLFAGVAVAGFILVALTGIDKMGK